MRKILLCGLVGLGVYSSFNCGQNKHNYSKIVLSNYNRKKFPKVFFELECLVLKLA